MRKGSLKMVAEAPKKLQTAVGELSLTASAAPTLFVNITATAVPSSAIDSTINRLSYDSSSGIKEKKKYWSDMILRDEYVKNLTEYGWIATYIPYYQEKWMKRGMINTRHPLNEYNWNNHCLCDQHSKSLANLIA